MHAARQFCGVKICHARHQPNAAQFFQRNCAGLFAWAFLCAAQQTKRHIFPNPQTVKQGATLKQHAKAGQKGITVGVTNVLAINDDLATVRRNQPQDAFEQDGFACARSADDHHAFALGQRQIDPAQNVVAAKAFGDVLKSNHAEKKSSVKR